MTRDLYVASLDGASLDAAAPPGAHPGGMRRITQEPGLHAVTMAHDLSYYVDRYTSRSQPQQASLRRLDGSLIAWLEENRLDARHPDAPYLAGNSIAESGTLTAADGQALYYQVFRPRDFDAHRRYPAIVNVYGGPAHQEVLDQWRGDTFTQILTRAGFVVFQLDNRGSAFRGTAFQAPISGALGGVEVEDQVLGARWLGSQPWIDPQRIGVMGWSYGGYMALLLMFRAPDVFKPASPERRSRTGPCTTRTTRNATSAGRRTTPTPTRRARCCRMRPACAARCWSCTAWPMTTCCSPTRRGSCAGCSSWARPSS